ncbi:hypothetical protein GM608_02400 [Bombella sp. ESL0380]|uniref:YobI family P-loop NTPase n=1 Tax=Bombella sp. ESL0380 TaxID=2676444 RepID=UPI00139B509C|nr:hypothetical protein [Bombella sp. ESL0380]
MIDENCCDFDVSLVSLKPAYIEEEHGTYVKALEEALKNKENLNIALSGPYGTGKSSILKKFTAGKNGVIELSLSTLSLFGKSTYEKIKESNIPDNEEQATLPPQAMTLTNQIQKEIVKQLLYRESPKKAPASRFRRIERFQCMRCIFISFWASVILTVIFFLAGWVEKILKEFPLLYAYKPLSYAVFPFVFFVSIFCLFKIFDGRIRVKQLSAGSATVSLDENSASYFDQYLDEIVYFFDTSKKDIVIFEDIDRFDDCHIFDTLRSLNTLLNNSPQIKKNIRFIYAVKDSIFERREGETDLDGFVHKEAVNSNRTKFFDIIIPIVPFVTYLTSKSLAKDIIDEKIKDHKIDNKLINIAMSAIPDMRLLKNILNEFIVFRKMIFSGGGEALKLKDNELFAMVVYKNTHLEDFENIRFRKSRIDDLYRMSREFINRRINLNATKIKEMRDNLNEIENLEGNSVRLHDIIKKYIENVGRDMGVSVNVKNFTVGSVHHSMDEMKSSKFWMDIEQGAYNLVWECNERISRSAYLSQFEELKINLSRDRICDLVGREVDFLKLMELDRENLEKEIEKLDKENRYLNVCDFHELITYSSSMEVSNAEEGDKDFITEVRTLLQSKLAYQLVEHGYVGRNFSLYTTRYHDSYFSSNAMNFIIHHIECDVMDEYFHLDHCDVENIINDYRDEISSKYSFYNIDILKYLLDKEENGLDIISRKLSLLGKHEKKFLNSYYKSDLVTNEDKIKLAQKLAKFSSEIIFHFIGGEDFNNNIRIILINGILSDISCLKEQSIDESVADYLLENYDKFSVLSGRMSHENAESISQLYRRAKVCVPALRYLGEELQKAFVRKNIYKLTCENISLAADLSKDSISLNRIRSNNKEVYDYVLSKISEYIEVIKGKVFSIDNNESFVEVIRELFSYNVSCLKDVLINVHDSCVVEKIESLPDDVWPLLAETGRFQPTLHNICLYVGENGEVDENLASLLKAKEGISEVEVIDENNSDEGETRRENIAYCILNCPDNFFSSDLRTKLVSDLKLGKYLQVDKIVSRDNKLFGWLIERDIIVDDEKSYERLFQMEWSARSDFISKSKNFRSYMTPDLVAGDLTQLFKDKKIPSDIKKYIVQNAENFMEVFDGSSWEEIIKYAYKKNIPIVGAVLERAVRSLERIDDKIFVGLLVRVIDQVGKDVFLRILCGLGGVYLQLSDESTSRLRIEDSKENIKILERLRNENIVSSWKKAEKDSIRVNKKRMRNS